MYEMGTDGNSRRLHSLACVRADLVIQRQQCCCSACLLVLCSFILFCYYFMIDCMGVLGFGTGGRVIP